MSGHKIGSRVTVARALLAAGLFWIALVVPVRAASGDVVVLTADGVVDSVMAGYIGGGITSAEHDGAAAVVIELDTPGGSLASMQDITTAMLESTVPVIVWVAPAGGWAASAGTFITMAGNLAYMAPGTSIGAASPVDQNGNDITGTEGTKVMNIAVSTITSIAQTRGRDPTWPVSAVRDAKSASAAEAVQLKVVDGIAESLDSVLAQANGKQVATKSGPVTVAVSGRPVVDSPMNPVLALLHLVADPNLAFVLFVIGLAGIVIEFVHPTVIAGILGGLCLIFAFVGFGSLPLNLAGLLLVAFAMLLFALETQLTSHGLLAVGGLVAFVLGASILYTPPAGNPVEPLVSVAWPVIASGAIAMGGFAFAIAWAAMRIRRMAPPSGMVGSPIPLGAIGVVQAPLAPIGTVYLAGETWSARTADGRSLERDAPVRFVSLDGLTAVVAPEPAAAAPAGPASAGLAPGGGLVTPTNPAPATRPAGRP